MNKTFRIFVSSVGKMMNEERNTLQDRIWKSGHIPIAMEAFTGHHDQTSIEVVQENLKQADIIIFVFGFTYGTVIGNELKCDKNCSVKEYCTFFNSNKRTKAKECVISYTHFEYLYAKKNNILHYCIIQKDIEKVANFKKRLEQYLKTDSHSNTQEILEAEYYNGRDKQTALTLDDAMERWSYFYDSNDMNIGIRSAITETYANISARFVSDTDHIFGLVDGQQASDDIRKKSQEINDLKKKIDENQSTMGNVIRLKQLQ